MRKRKGYPGKIWRKKFTAAARIVGYDDVQDLPTDHPLGNAPGNIYGDATVIDGARDEPPNLKWLRWRMAMYWQMGLDAGKAGARAVEDLRALRAGKPIDPPELLAPPEGADDESVERLGAAPRRRRKKS